MSKKKNNLIFFYLVFYLSITLCLCKEKYALYRCGFDELKIKPIPLEGGPLTNQVLLKRKLDSDGFKDFKIYFDPTNLKNDLQKQKMTEYQEFFLNSIQKAIETLQKLLKVKPLEQDYCLNDENIKNIEIDDWDKEKFGTNACNSGKNLNSLGYDLVIFGKLKDLGENTLANAGARYKLF